MMESVLPKSKNRASKGVSDRRLACQVCLVLAALLGLGSASCAADPQDESIGEQIQGEWALTRLSGGLAGINQAYAAEDSPETITFDDQGEYTYVRRATGASRDTTRGRWFITNVARSHDTLSFRFTDQLPGAFAGRDMRLVGRTVLETQPTCCDRFEYTFVKR